jgi:two-component system response regulator
MISEFEPPEIFRVVIVEDNEDDRELLVRQLRKSGIEHHVKFLVDGKEALRFFAELPPAVPFCDLIAIFLDLKLPGMHGLDVLRGIRKTPRVRNTPVVIMTSSLDPKDFEACQDLGVAAYVPKPITFEAFSKAITTLPPMSASQGGRTPTHVRE